MPGPGKHEAAPGISHLRVTLGPAAYIGPGRADLLDAIAATGSIAAAGKRMGMSYKRAWALVQALNEGFNVALVETSRGGSDQGGARLTAAGETVLQTYRRMQARAGAAIAADVAALQALLGRNPEGE